MHEQIHSRCDWLPVSGACGSREPAQVETCLTSFSAHTVKWMKKYLRCLFSCRLEPFHTGYQSHAGGQSTLAAALDMDSLPTNHAECSSPFQRVSIQAGGNGGGGAGGGALLPGSKREQVGRACSGDVASAGESGRYHLALIRAGACVRVRDGRCTGRGE